MSEADIFQAYYNAIGLSYTAVQWWVTVSTALVVATYFAAKHIPHWLFGLIILLYLMTATSSIYEERLYTGIAELYGTRLAAAWAANHIVPPGANALLGAINSVANVSVFVLGTAAAISFSFVTWRSARQAS
jgi:hypothetical protein